MTRSSPLGIPEASRHLGTARAWPGPFQMLIGTSRPFVDTVERAIREASRSYDTLLLVGGPGTGKELLARAMHEHGPRSGAPFMIVDCAALGEDALQAELFGRERGALSRGWTVRSGMLELAGRGTLLLEHVDRLSATLQVKLLRAVEDRRAHRLGGIEEFEVECAIVASCSPGVESMVDRGLFRDDLFRRLSRIRIDVPSLEERGEDVRALAEHFIEETVREEGLLGSSLSADALDALISHGWPGNVRELRSVLRSALLREGGGVLGSEALAIRHRIPATPSSQPTPGRRHIFLPQQGKTLQEIEEEAVWITLEICEGNKSAAARALGISRPTLLRRLEAYRQRSGEGGEAA